MPLSVIAMEVTSAADAITEFTSFYNFGLYSEQDLMVAECFKLVIEYIIMTAEAWFSLVVGESRFFPWFLLGFAGFLLLVVLRFVLRKVYR